MPMVTAHIEQDVYTSNPCLVSTRFQTEILPMFLAHELPTAPRPACQNESADVGVVGVRAGGLGEVYDIATSRPLIGNCATSGPVECRDVC
jgi:hypothetical protein